jgi:hypothetical protein
MPSDFETRREAHARAWNQRRKLTGYLAATGRPVRVSPDRCIAHVLALRDEHGMSCADIAREAGLNDSSVDRLLRGAAKLIYRDTEEKILAVRPRPVVAHGAYVPSVGTTRRLRALAAAGFTCAWIAEQTGWKKQFVSQLTLHPAPTVFAVTARRVADLYQRYESRRPEDCGVTARGAKIASGLADRNGYAPPACWDDDTIDDPNAIPQWTGECGSMAGHRIHQRRGIPFCEPCREARRAYTPTTQRAEKAIA